LDPCWHKFGATNYSYARNDPWNRVDPFGTIAPIVVALLVIGAAALIGAIIGAATAGHEGPWVGAAVGAIEGAFAAAGAIIGGVVTGGNPIGIFVGGVIGGAVGTFLGCITKDLLTGNPICWDCAIKGAVTSVFIDLLMLGLGKIPGVKGLFKSAMRKWFPKLWRPFKDKLLDEIPERLTRNLKNHPLRLAYEKEVADLEKLVEPMRRSGMSDEQIARDLSQRRRDLGVKYKDATPQPLRDFIYFRNEQAYQDPLGPSFDWLMNKYNGDYQEIIKKAYKPNIAIEDVLSGPHFKEWLQNQPDEYFDNIDPP
jgi:hypothetical protein